MEPSVEKKQESIYKNSLNLPQTKFPMKGNGPIRELEFQSFWENSSIYKKALENRKGHKRFLLHDGPPYLSSDKIHIGTALNKILKDIIVKYKTLRGYYSPYMPGYDCHGLPIENAVLKNEKTSRDKISTVELRKKCEDFANKNRVGQEAKFKRLGVLGDWKNAYMTLHPHIEARQLELFGKMYDKGFIYRGLKSVYWCTACQTALAEAEIEYVENYKSPSIYVAFKIATLSEKSQKLSKYNDLRIVIWTTTPWTIPGNMAICLHKDFDYVVVESETYGKLLLARGLVESFAKKLNQELKILDELKGSDLEHSLALHPIYNRSTPIVLGDHVTLDSGTGCVHTAPGHGMEDFLVGKKYGLDIFSPVDEKGCYTSEADIGNPLSDLKGIHVHKDGNQTIIQKLVDAGALIKQEDYLHSYPHCWRSKTPIIFRATKQWFCSVDKFRKKILSEIDNVNWIPSSGKNRIYTMVEGRSDWCISRQRRWGVPIPAFYCMDCSTDEKEIIHLNQNIISKVSDLVKNNGSNIWWEKSPQELLPEGYKCTCGKSNFKQEFDTMDVWFDSGSTHLTVVDENKELGGSPAELYLEGSDQHRGWFQSSLITSVAVKDQAPYKSVLTHGFVVDETGRKMSKSLGNVVDPDDVIKLFGADILRLWVASVDYTVDIRIGDTMIKQLSEVYRNIRNTLRFILGNLCDFNSESDYIEYQSLLNIDKYLLHKLEMLKNSITQCMDDYQFFKYYQLLQNFCTTDLSSFYLDLNKDRLYTVSKKSLSRRASQTVLYELLNTLIPMLVPILPHLAEDVWINLPSGLKKEHESPLCMNWAVVKPHYENGRLAEKMETILSVKSEVYQALELARKEKKIGKSIESKVIINFKDRTHETLAVLEEFSSELPLIFIVSQVQFFKEISEDRAFATHTNKDYSVIISGADGDKCPRCWKFCTTIGSHEKYSDICSDCSEAVECQ